MLLFRVLYIVSFLSILYMSGMFQGIITKLLFPFKTIIMSTTPSSQPSAARTPVYFLGIGGPSFIGDTTHPAYAQLAAIGKEITTKVKPKAIVVFSAHWQDGPSRISINAAEHTDIIYDFYGFPAHYYEYKFPYKGSPEIAEKVIEKLSGANIEVERVKRGLDHGVWAGFMVGESLFQSGRYPSPFMTQATNEIRFIAFDPQTNPLNVPIVQVSLFNNEDHDLHYRMGQALESLRDEGILIVGTGMASHNLQDYRAIRGSGKTMPYVSHHAFQRKALNGLNNLLITYNRYVHSFDEALKVAAGVKPEERRTAMSALMKRSDARQAHPTLDHILPMHVSAGAAGSDVGERLWTMPDASLSWAQYRFGKVPNV